MKCIFFLFLGLFLAPLAAGAVEEEDSLAIEQTRKEAYQLSRQGNLVGSIEKLEAAIARATALGLPESLINNRLRFLLANRYSYIGDFDRAIELASDLELFYKETNDLQHELEVKNNLGVFHQVVGRYELAYGYFLDGWIIQRDGNEIVDQLDWLDGLSASCIKLGRSEEAYGYLAKAEQLLPFCPDKLKDELRLYYLVNRANHALATGNEAEAETSLLACIALAEKSGDRKGADACRLIAILYLAQGKYEAASSYAEKMQRFLSVEEDKSTKDPYLLQAHFLQARALLAKGDYQAAVASCKKAEVQASFFQRQYLFNESKLFIGAFRRENLEVWVMALHHLYEETGEHQFLEEALTCADRAKSNVLNERWSDLQVLSDEQKAEAVSWRYKVIFQLNQLEDSTDKAQSIDLRNTLDSLNEALGITKDVPFSVSDLQWFQMQLTRNEVYLSYLVIDSVVFRFDIEKEQIEWHSLTLRNPEDVLRFYQLLKDPTSTPQAFLQASEKLLPLLPSALQDGASFKEIHIVPDGILNYLVFDALPIASEGADWPLIPYAGLSYNFSYDFSLQSSKRAQEREQPDRYIAFAPDYGLLDGWAILKHSEEVVAEANGHFEGQSFKGIAASKAHFQQYGPEADLLHLYAHGVSNDSSYDASYLVLHDDKIYVDEVLSLRLRASLCVLTACEVGLGKAQHGEGITSIAWSFKAAGVENVIQSMWKLNEESSALLMNNFFDHLASGESSSVALATVKAEYLNNPELSDRLKHPYYWAGIGHYGAGAKFSESGGNSLVIISSAVMLLVIGLLLFKAMRRKGQPIVGLTS